MNNEKNQEERLANLESRLSFQEYTIQELNKEVLLQSETITSLKSAIKKLSGRIKELSELHGENLPENEVPPHY